MSFLELSKALHREADKILNEDGIDKTISKYGQIYYTGSYNLDLMAYGDIDISMIMSESGCPLSTFFELGNAIALLDGTLDMRFQNFYKFSVEGLPKGLYWGVKYKNNSTNRIWKIDLWALDKDAIAQNQLYQ